MTAVGDATAVEARTEIVGAGSAAPSVSARSLSGEKAKRIVDAMRHSVAKRGTAGSTFDHVSREAGVSRGLLHCYCLLYTSDAADDLTRVDLGGRRLIKKK